MDGKSVMEEYSDTDVLEQIPIFLPFKNFIKAFKVVLLSFGQLVFAFNIYI